MVFSVWSTPDEESKEMKKLFKSYDSANPQVIKLEIPTINVVHKKEKERNPVPPTSSSWYHVASTFGVGIDDLDILAKNLGYRGWVDLDMSLTPQQVAESKDIKFCKFVIEAVRRIFPRAVNKSDQEILNVLWGR